LEANIASLGYTQPATHFSARAMAAADCPKSPYRIRRPVVSRPANIPTLVIAIVALVASVLSLVVAFSRTPTVATSSGGDSTSPVTQTTEVAQPPESGSTESTSATPAPTDSGGVDPQADFTISYEDNELHIPLGVRVDLDEPRVNVKSGDDFEYDVYSNGQFGTYSAAAKVRSSNVTPQDCAGAIQTSPLTTPIAPSEGLVLCIQTSAEHASEQGISQKIARVSIKSIDKQDVVTALVTAWDVPT
jgi:hypothetical protein